MPLPKGFTLDTPTPMVKLPKGFTLDAETSVADQARASLANRGLTPGMVKAGMDDPDFRPATFTENARARGAGLATQIPATLASAVTVPVEAAADVLSFGPTRRIFAATPGQGLGSKIAYTATHPQVALPRLPVTQAINEGAAEAARGLGGLMGVPREAITDVATAQGKIMGDVAAPIVGKAAGALGGAVKQAAKETLAAAAPKFANDMVNTPLRFFKFGANPGEAIAGLKTKGGEGLQSLVPQLNQKIADGKGRLNTLLSNPTVAAQQVDVAPIIQGEIAAAKAKAADLGNEALVARLDKLEKAQLAKFGGKTVISPSNLQKYKEYVGDVTKFSEDAIEGTVNATMQDIYIAADRAIDKIVPAAAGLNRDLANAITAKKALEYAEKLGLRESPFELLSPRRWLGSSYVKSRMAATAKKLGQ